MARCLLFNKMIFFAAQGKNRSQRYARPCVIQRSANSGATRLNFMSIFSIRHIPGVSHKYWSKILFATSSTNTKKSLHNYKNILMYRSAHVVVHGVTTVSTETSSFEVEGVSD